MLLFIAGAAQLPTLFLWVSVLWIHSQIMHPIPPIIVKIPPDPAPTATRYSFCSRLHVACNLSRCRPIPRQPAIAPLSSPPLGQAFYPYDGLCIEFFPLFVMRLLKLALEVWSYGKQVRCSIVGSSRSLPSLRQTFAERTSAPKRQKMEGERLILSIFAVGITRGLVLGSNPNGALLAIQASPKSLSYSHQSSQH